MVVMEHGHEDGAIVIFDFDCTIVDVDSDPWVAQQLGASSLFHSLQPLLPWNDMMDVLMLALYKKGHSVDDVQEALHSIPIELETINAIKETYAHGCELRIVSDANEFFIETILQKHGIQHLFRRIHTNPSFIDDGRIHIGPYHCKQLMSHGCALCPPNMCKGMVLDKIRKETQKESNNSARRIIYLGDGIGDLCPILRLGPEDCILPRQGYPLSHLIASDIHKVKAKVYPWNGGSEMKQQLIPLIACRNRYGVATEADKFEECQSATTVMEGAL